MMAPDRHIISDEFGAWMLALIAIYAVVSLTVPLFLRKRAAEDPYSTPFGDVPGARE